MWRGEWTTFNKRPIKAWLKFENAYLRYLVKFRKKVDCTVDFSIFFCFECRSQIFPQFFSKLKVCLYTGKAFQQRNAFKIHICHKLSSHLFCIRDKCQLLWFTTHTIILCTVGAVGARLGTWGHGHVSWRTHRTNCLWCSNVFHGIKLIVINAYVVCSVADASLFRFYVTIARWLY